MTTLSYCTTEADGRIMDNMMWLDPKIEDELKTLIAELKKPGAKVSGQVTHCGHFSQLKNLEKSHPAQGAFKNVCRDWPNRGTARRPSHDGRRYPASYSNLLRRGLLYEAGRL